MTDEDYEALSALAEAAWRITDPENCPAHLRESLDAYVTSGIPVGGFLEAVLSNDLMGACGRADLANLCLLPAIVSYVFNHLPHNCHGSREIYEGWLAAHTAKRAEAKP